MTASGSRCTLLAFILLLLLAATACDPSVLIEVPADNFPDDAVPPRVDAPHEEWYEIYFTNPTCPPEEERTGGVDEVIAADLLMATERVDVAAFDLDAEPIVEALVALKQNGVDVRVVTDEDNEALSSIRRLRRHGISVIADERSALMHNKFVVIDDRIVWTGSLNFTTNGAYCNNNNVVRIDEPLLAANYRAEMDEMVEQRAFGPTSPVATPNERLQIGDTLLENYFAPEIEVAPRLVELVANAEEEILFMAFSFTHDALGQAMIDAAATGIPVRGVFETVGSETEFSVYPSMASSVLPTISVRQDGNARLMHHKVIVLDRETVVLGSFNFTASANDRNDENVLIVHDPTFTSYFVEEFDLVWDEAQR
ncbi:MAG: phospholipase D-like domain-containing protein [Candidatus Promineifilaceae bacterium]|nr:phospholipase D-like domain-containing protein [Candidatus Promineifilaceae bacterium]